MERTAVTESKERMGKTGKMELLDLQVKITFNFGRRENLKRRFLFEIRIGWNKRKRWQGRP